MSWCTCEECGSGYDDNASIDHECADDRLERLESEVDTLRDRVARLEAALTTLLRDRAPN